MERQQDAYDYIASLFKVAEPIIDKIAEEWDLLTLEEVDKLCGKLRELVDDAQGIYASLEGDNIGIIDLVHHLEYAYQDAEDLYKEKEAKQ
jgi:endonuclease/exonuclease/phosphatase family metal-dependent hydrolase